MAELVGRTLGTYHIVAEIGHGGMADVYRAEQPSVGREVAIKVLSPYLLQDRTFLERFTREVKFIAQLQHPRILPVYDSGEQDGLPYIVMAYMPGGTMADRIQESGQGLPLDAVVRWVSEIAEGLDFAHEQQIIHRDFKPSNVLLDRKGNAHLADFGIAKVSAATAQLTGSGLVGTPAYMAPEMSQQREATPAIDVYALGVTLFQMVTGQHPYRAETPMGVLLAHVTEAIPDARVMRPDLPEAVQVVIEKAMAKNPVERYPSAGELAADLVGAVRGASIAAPARSSEQVEVLGDRRTLQAAKPAAARTAPGSMFWRSALPVVGVLVIVGLAVLGVRVLLPALDRPSATHASAPAAVTSPSAGEHANAELSEPGAVISLTLSPQRVLYPEAQQVRHVAFSPDGSRLVSGAEAAIKLWNAQTGGELMSIPLGAPARAPDVAFSPDGKLVAGMANLLVMLWDAETGELVRELAGHTGYPVSLAFSPDGSRLVSGGEDRKAILWDVETGQQVSALTAKESVGSVAFSPDGTMLAIGSGYDVILADAATVGQVRSLVGHDASVNEVAFAPDSQKIASASRNGTVIVWEVSTGEQIHRLSAVPEAIYGVAFSPDGSLLAASTERGRILVWEMRTGDLLVTRNAHDAEIYDLAFSPDGGTLVSASADTTIGFWSVR